MFAVNLVQKCSDHINENLWHIKLGHPAPLIFQNILHKLRLKLASSTLKFCDSCKLGKMHQLLFQASTHKAKSPLEQVFIDTVLFSLTPTLDIHGCFLYN
ncbi:hypothetical protein ACOSQ3_004665 [Xanthoceras sorbifolium]